MKHHFVISLAAFKHMGDLPMVFYQDRLIEAITVHNWHLVHQSLDYIYNLFDFWHYVDEIINVHTHSFAQHERVSSLN